MGVDIPEATLVRGAGRAMKPVATDRTDRLTSTLGSDLLQCGNEHADRVPDRSCAEQRLG